jgi:2-dehydropantoate 2-reductase
MIRVAVLGAGAVGCFFGGMLARAGHDVTLIGRPVHVDAFNKSGLHFEGPGFDELVPVHAATVPEAVGGARLVLFCVKSTDTDAAAAQIAPWLATDSIVVNLQNGVDNTERIQAHTGRPVIPAVVYVATEMAGPGHLRHHGRGDLVIGAADGHASADTVVALARVQQWFARAGVPVVISENVTGDLWAKLVVNCAYNAVSAIAQVPYGFMIASTGMKEVMRDVVAEVLAVAAASQVRMAPGLLESVYRLAETMATQYSSTAQDLARSRPSEIDHLNGFVVRRGDAMGVPVPANRVLYALVRLIESKNMPAAVPGRVVRE